ncbi:heme exporter protein CcmD [Psychrosphaera aquimarina]|jgi:heme exporter protein D|uniref:Heme exporter protein D n=1 Tax=Psychrosphaera aquimarina TaxID=2044854 RepID=A0ABU3R4L6_9GAMM|nr:heme exporter protein CcmD [Psychrosphaera aquimarina]MDU0114616.1 heme exporter protein CcmD [Psychrosphaera aquimarina]
MHFNSISEALAMGGYGPYVWSTVGIVIAVLLFLIIHSMTAKKRTLTMLRLEQERANKIALAKQSNNDYQSKPNHN